MKEVHLLKEEEVIAEKKSIYVDFFKPFFDKLLALILILFTSPLFLIIYALIKIDSQGPAVFSQPRVGLNGNVFTIYKFRTMYVKAPSQGVSPTSSSDPRITKVGKLLRRTSLDELPQLINILLGHMSFIGPRPEQELIVRENYGSYESQRFLIKPGITGLWQISKFRTQPIHEHLEYDFEYIGNVSVLTDIKIVINTLKVMLVKSNTH